MKRLWMVTLAIGLFSGASNVEACTVCGSDAGQQLRARVWNQDFYRTLGYMAAPALILSGIVAGIHFGVPARFGGRKP